MVASLGWKYAGIVWAYAFVWFLVTDPVKLLAYKVLAYKVLDTVKAEITPTAKVTPRSAAKAPSDTTLQAAE